MKVLTKKDFPKNYDKKEMEEQIRFSRRIKDCEEAMKIINEYYIEKIKKHFEIK